MAEKVFLLDTNVLLYDSHSIFSFEDNLVGIPFIVLEELDQFKGESSERGRVARDVIRRLDMLRSQGFLGDGVKLENGGKLKVFFFSGENLPQTPLFLDIADNEIILTALTLKNKGYDVRFISKDLNARIKADVLGIHAEDYTKDTIREEEIYKGWVVVDVPAIQLKKSEPDELGTLAQENSLAPNQFVHLQANNNPYNFRIFRYLGGKRFRAVDSPQLTWPIVPRNPQQLMALNLLFDPAIKLITLIGPAGTGKTFLALLAGLHQVLISDEFRKVLVSRPVIPLGPDIGYLPGDIQEKLRSWMQPMYDNIDLIVHASRVGKHLEQVGDVEREQRARKEWKRQDKERGFERRMSSGPQELKSLDDLAAEGKISLEAITYMRGRSIPYQFILIDEVQNLNPHEAKTIISRVGEGSKIVLCGDPYQIDSPYLDFSSNGLVVATNKFKGQELFGTVFLETSERSELSKLAGELL